MVMIPSIAVGQGRMQRKLRSPSHPFQISALPYHITPFLCAPVLPGETMQKLQLQSRVVSDPILNPLVGWWKEYYFFYVKLSDMYEREEFREMVLNPSWSKSDVITAQGSTTAAPAFYYCGGPTMINYAKLAYRRCVDCYFRDEDETYADHEITDALSRVLSCAKIVGDKSVFDSVSLSDDETTQDVTLLDASSTSDTLTASEVVTGMRLWNMQRMYGITEMSYEDWLVAMGGTPEAPAEAHEPELLRYLRHWTYPTNTVEPTTGVPSSAVSWSIAESADKNRSFKEPGFIIGLTVTRPKVYVRAQEGSFTSCMGDFKSWLPVFFRDDPAMTRLTVHHTEGPLATAVTDTNGYQVDIKDLYLYGEQWVNRPLNSTNALGATNANLMDCVAADLSNVRYPVALSDINELFSNTSNCYIREDGIVNLRILSSPTNPLWDTSPRGGVRSGETSGGNF